MATVERHLLFASEGELTDLLSALDNARGRISSDQAALIRDLYEALRVGNAPAGEPQPVAEPEGTIKLFIAPSDLCVYVVLPGVGTMRLADGPAATSVLDNLSDRDRAIARTLLAVAQNELMGNQADTPRPGIQQPYPVPPPAPWNWGL